MRENLMEGVTLTAYQFDEITTGPLARCNDRDPTRLVLMGIDTATWQILMQLRGQAAADGAFAATHVYIPSGHNLASCDSWRVLSGTSFGALSERLDVTSPTSGVQLRALTASIPTTDRFYAIEINDADRATSMVTYQLGEVFLTRQLSTSTGPESGWVHGFLRNERVDESESGLIRVIKKGEIRRQLAYSWRALVAADRTLLENLLQGDGAAVGFPVIPAGESAAIFARLSAHRDPRQDMPVPSVNETYEIGTTLTEVL